MTTTAEQSAGGSQAAATGQGALLAGRTKNPGTAAAAIQESSRNAGEQLSKNALGIKTANAQLKERQRQAGLTGMENMTALDTGAGVNALRIVPEAVNANTNAANESWDWAKYILDPAMQAAGQGAGLAAGGCWIAEAIYGVTDSRTRLVRAWLNGPFMEGLFGRIVMAVYLAAGRQVAWVARRSPLLRRTLKPLFDRALAEAIKHYDAV